MCTVTEFTLYCFTFNSPPFQISTSLLPGHLTHYLPSLTPSKWKSLYRLSHIATDQPSQQQTVAIFYTCCRQRDRVYHNNGNINVQCTRGACIYSIVLVMYIQFNHTHTRLARRVRNASAVHIVHMFGMFPRCIHKSHAPPPLLKKMPPPSQSGRFAPKK